MSRFKRRQRKDTETPPRRRRDLSGMAKPKPGNAQKHGAFSALKKLREGGLDGRSKQAREIKLFEHKIVEDLGGIENITGMQQSLIHRASEILVVINSISNWICTQGVMDGDGLQKVLRHSYLSYQNSFKRILESIFTMASNPLPPPPGAVPLLPDRPVIELDTSDERAAGVLEILSSCGAITRGLDEKKKTGKPEVKKTKVETIEKEKGTENAPPSLADGETLVQVDDGTGVPKYEVQRPRKRVWLPGVR